jgi:hypothetical protein
MPLHKFLHNLLNVFVQTAEEGEGGGKKRRKKKGLHTKKGGFIL